MSSSSVDNDSGGEEASIDGETGVQAPEHTNGHASVATNRPIADLLDEERGNAVNPLRLGDSTNPYKLVGGLQSPSEDDSVDALPRGPGSPIDSLLSVPDDTLSVQGSLLSSPAGSSVLPSVASLPGLQSPTPSFRPFDRRFLSRLSSSNLSPARSSSPAFLRTHSRNASLSSQILPDSGDTDTPSPPWEVVRWTKLKKMNGQAFSEVGKRAFGVPTCISVSASIVLGTSKGIILIFDYHQNLKSIIGTGTKALESGAITSIAISADHLIVAGGHANGSIFTWETARAAKPVLHIPSLEESQLVKRTMDGHVSNVAIRHLGFLGTRHTALVSADDRGMAFSHLATRGMGVVGRSVKTTRILGRYPNDMATTGRSRRPSTVLAFAPLPLGNVERGTDTLGLTAMLTPYLLVIVSTTPVAQTQHKAARPKEVAAHSALSGCLAWFPAVKLKAPDPQTGSDVSKVKLVYCWSNILTVLDVDEEASANKDKPPSLSFKPRSRWKSEEAIVAVQWLSRSVLTVLTITQRLIILEDGSMRMTEAFDLVSKHIYHQDLFSKCLHTLVEQLDEADPSMHGVVADAFYMSLKTYKSRIFLLGFNDVSIGTLSNWADRLIALMEDGDYIGAIQLATSYYTGDADKLTVGLPEDTKSRHSMVQDKLLEIMTASLKFAFNQRKKQDSEAPESEMKELAEACFEACLSIDDIDFLFEEVFEWYEDADIEGIFLETLEPYILEKRIVAIPPGVVKSMVTYFVTQGLESRLEEMICHMETATLDIDQVTTLFKQHNLYDALIYVWNRALHDYITPLTDLLMLLIPLTQNGDYFTNGNVMEDPIFGVNALKMFPYMSYTFTGRIYPTGEALDDQEALKAKAEIYRFIFSGETITWPKNNGKPFLTQPTQIHEPSYPYLRMILKFDAPSFLSALNEAFEDSFLNDTPEHAVNGESNRGPSAEHIPGFSINRQHIITIMLEVMNPSDFATEDTIYLDMFIARNLPKFSQYLLLSGTALHKVLAGLCNYPGHDLADDAQLSAEYLLSVYHPPDLESLLSLFSEAGFFRVLKSVYKSEKQYSKLVQTYFDDPDDREAIFDCIAGCLRPQSGLTKRQAKDVQEVMMAHAADLVHLSAAETAQMVGSYAPELHKVFLESIADEDQLQYTYLHAIFEPESSDKEGAKAPSDTDLVEQYVQLMCQFDSSHVAAYVELVQASDLRLDRVLPYMEESGVIDAAVILMARDGQLKDAINRLMKHLRTLESALSGLLSGPIEDMEAPQSEEAAVHLLDALQKYTGVGIWLCQGQKRNSAAAMITSPVRRKSNTNKELLPEEALWLDLIDTTVQITRGLSASLEDARPDIDHEKLLAQLRTLVQRTFTALLTSTSTPSASGQDLSFLRILRAFLTKVSISAANLSDLRAVLGSIFSAYAYEESILSLSNRLLEKDLFVNVQSATELRQRGWRPRGSTCEGCGRRVWGPGVSGDIFTKWEAREEQDLKRRTERRSMLAGGHVERGKGRAHARNTSKASVTEMMKRNGKGPGNSPDGDGGNEETGGNKPEDTTTPQDLGPLVVLACRHIYHQSCLEAVQVDDSTALDGREFKCPIDG